MSRCATRRPRFSRENFLPHDGRAGGVRRGTDVVKALALGAQAALIGRLVLWGLATDGEEGALRVLELLKAEFDLAMALSGAKNIAGIDLLLLG